MNVASTAYGPGESVLPDAPLIANEIMLSVVTQPLNREVGTEVTLYVKLYLLPLSASQLPSQLKQSHVSVRIFLKNNNMQLKA